VQLPSYPGSGTAKLNVWDFGGQEIMHGTPQFFLTERTLDLLVLAGREGREGREDEDAEYWLKLIHGFSGNSPILLVLNRIEEFPFDLNRQLLREKYATIHGFVQTDCKTKRWMVRN
jgi:internalin A